MFFSLFLHSPFNTFDLVVDLLVDLVHVNHFLKRKKEIPRNSWRNTWRNHDKNKATNQQINKSMKCVVKRRDDMQMTWSIAIATAHIHIEARHVSNPWRSFPLVNSDFTLEVIFLMSMSLMLFSYFFASLVHSVSSIWHALTCFKKDSHLWKTFAGPLPLRLQPLPAWTPWTPWEPLPPQFTMTAKCKDCKHAAFRVICLIRQMTTKATLYLMQCLFLQHKCTYQSSKIMVNGVWFNIVRRPNSKRWPLLI